jgi:hypothetical protein
LYAELTPAGATRRHDVNTKAFSLHPEQCYVGKDEFARRFEQPSGFVGAGEGLKGGAAPRFRCPSCRLVMSR